MKPRSSIFSFNTLSVGGLRALRVPRGVALAIVLLIGAECVAKYALRAGWIRRDPSARGLVETYIDRVEDEKPAVWLVGNSTLDEGIDTPAFARNIGKPAVDMPLGSATLRASATMMDYYFDHTEHRPNSIIVFLSKDDLNPNGRRARNSKKYEEIAAGGIGEPWRFITLYAARGSLRDKAERVFDRVRRLAGGKPVPKKEYKDPVFDGMPSEAGDTEFVQYTDLLNEYAFDDGAFSHLAAVAKEHGVSDVTVVLMPATDQYIKFHDQRVHNLPYAELRQRVAAQCAANGLRFLDEGAPSTNYAQFRDGYHLNRAGQKLFTARIAEHYLAKLATPGTPSPTSAPSSPAALATIPRQN